MAGARARPRRADRGNGARQRFTATRGDSQPAMSSMWRPTCRPMTAGASDVSGIDRADRGGCRRDAARCGHGRAFAGAAGLYPCARRVAARAALLPGRDAGVRPGGRARDASPSARSSAAPIRPRRSTARFRAVLEAFGCPILPMRYESAELAKISINCCLVASVTVGNTLAELCEKIGADWSEIAPALKLDRRIGAYAYLAPGLGHRRRQSRARPRYRAAACREPHGTEAGLIARLAAQQPPPAGLAAAAAQERVLVARRPSPRSAFSASPTRKTPIPSRIRRRSR